MLTPKVKDHIVAHAPPCDFWSVRMVQENFEEISVRQNQVEPLTLGSDFGAMFTVVNGKGIGYAATQDLSPLGIEKAFARAHAWASLSASKSILDFSKVAMPESRGNYTSPVQKPWNSSSLKEKIDYLKESCSALQIDDRIVDFGTSLSHTKAHHTYFASNGAQTEQEFTFIVPNMSATAHAGSVSQTRSLGGMRAHCQQTGLEILERINYDQQPKLIAEEALELLVAPNCPTENMDLVLAPDQMMLQIHESIGHPLELDRILGDERNYAGTSFVTLDMFGNYQYGSKLLNITFDPTVTNQLASYKYDDEGRAAQRTFVIKDGVLQTPLGSTLSQARANMPGVANARASSWNRPPIDRMANLNLEPMDSSFTDIISSVERGIYMQSNVSWSIDDSRNKFQFGCEIGRMIEKGKLTKVVRNPNYRGISATFWRSLKKVGNEQTRMVFGTPFCGKGEPNQVIRVGHASPVCLFSNIDVFGGE